MSSESPRARILEAALQLIAERGPSKLAIRRVAERAGVSVGLVSYHFEGRRGLLEASLTDLARPLFQMEEELMTLIREADALGPAIEEVYLRAFEVARQHRSLLRVAVMLFAQKGAAPRAWRTAAIDPFLARWAQLLHERTGAELETLRFRLHSVLVLTARYLASSDPDLHSVLGRTPTSDQLGSHLAGVAAVLLSAP